MSREFPLSDRYGDETQNPALQARRRAEALSRLCDENGFAEEEEEEN